MYSVNFHLTLQKLLIMFPSLLCVASQPYTIKIGCLVDNEHNEKAVRLAVDYINTNHIISNSVTLQALVNVTRVIDAFANIQNACAYAQEGSVAFIGPITSTSTKAVAPLSEALNLPHLAPVATNPLLGETKNFPMLLRMSSPDSVQSRALADLADHFGWKKMAILTSNTDYGINGLVEFQAQAAIKGWRILSVLQFQATQIMTESSAREQLQIIKKTGVRVVLLNCLVSFGRSVLKQAHDLSMTGPGWAWIVTDGITGTDELFDEMTPVPQFMEGLLGTRPSLTVSPLYVKFNELWKQNVTQEENLTVYPAQIIDCILAFSYGMREMLKLVNETSLVVGEQQNCEDPGGGYVYGKLLLELIQKVNVQGVTGKIAFNGKRAPLNPMYDIVNLKTNGWTKLASWTEMKGLKWEKRNDLAFMGGEKIVTDFITSLRNKTLTLVTKAEVPFVIINETKKAAGTIDWTNLMPNEDVYGYCIDLLLKLQGLLGFNSRLYYVEDDNFGIKNPETRQWNGMIKELVERKADIAISDLTINVQRESDVDFTVPYLDLGMAILMKIPEEEEVSPFRFTEPFTAELWSYMIGTCFIVGFFISFLNKSSPYDHHGEFMYIDNEEQEKGNFKAFRKFKRLKVHSLNEMNFANATWFSVASLLQQGGEVYPKSLSARLTALAWWLSIVIVVATYTANLAAWLTASRTTSSISGLADLYGQTRIHYGTVQNSAPEQYFRDSNLTMLQSMHENMKNRGTLAKSTKEAIKKVREESFAFIWDSSVLEYIQEQVPCNTVKIVGKLFGKIGYGFALQKNSPYNKEIIEHILQLRELGYMDELKKKWYEQNAECAMTIDSQSESAKQIEKAGGQLHLEHLLGVFYIVYGGLILSVVILILEWIIKCGTSIDRQDPMQPNSFCEAFKRRARCFLIDVKSEWFPCPFKSPSLDAGTGDKETPDKANTSKYGIDSNGGYFTEKHPVDVTQLKNYKRAQSESLIKAFPLKVSMKSLNASTESQGFECEVPNNHECNRHMPTEKHPVCHSLQRERNCGASVSEPARVPNEKLINNSAVPKFGLREKENWIPIAFDNFKGKVDQSNESSIERSSGDISKCLSENDNPSNTVLPGGGKEGTATILEAFETPVERFELVPDDNTDTKCLGHTGNRNT